MRNDILLALFVNLGGFVCVHSYSYTLEASLRSSLFTGYEVKSRPAANVPVTLTFMPIALNELNIKDETMTMTGYYTAGWSDSRLAWNTNPTYSSIDDIYTSSLETWRPTLIITNSVKDVGIIDDPSNMIRIRDSGFVMWSQPFLLKTYCECDPTFYPFDVQTCTITLSTWSYAKMEVSLQFFTNKEILMDFYQKNGEWEYISATTSITEENRDSRLYSMSNVHFKYRRRPQFIVFNTIIPMILLAFMSCFTFYVCIDSGEKIGYCLTVMLAYAVYLTIVSENMPTTSVKTSVLNVYLVIGLILDILSCPLTLFIIRCHHKSDEIPIPKWIKALTSCFRVMICEGRNSCCKKRKIGNDNVVDIKHHIDDDQYTGDDFRWTEISRIWDKFFLRFYLGLTTFVTVAFIAVLLYGFYFY